MSGHVIELRARVAAMLKELKGVSCKQLSKLVDVPPSTLRYHLDNMPSAHLAMTKSKPLQRWFYRDDIELAKAYVIKMDAKPRREIRVSREKEQVMCDALIAAGKSGMTTSELAKIAGVACETVQVFGRNLCQANGWRVVKGGGGMESRYFAPGIEPPPQMSRQERRRLSQRRRAAEKRAANPKQKRQVAKPKVKKLGSVRRYTMTLDSNQPIDMSRAKITICPSGKDMRFVSTSPEPFFARLGIGRYA